MDPFCYSVDAFCEWDGELSVSVGRLIASAPYSHESMSIIEKFWRIIGAMASSMLLYAGLREEFWEEEATTYAVPVQACNKVILHLSSCIVSILFSVASRRLNVEAQRGSPSAIRIIVGEVSEGSIRTRISIFVKELGYITPVWLLWC